MKCVSRVLVTFYFLIWEWLHVYSVKTHYNLFTFLCVRQIPLNKYFGEWIGASEKQGQDLGSSSEMMIWDSGQWQREKEADRFERQCGGSLAPPHDLVVRVYGLNGVPLKDI